tara:strand:+ start:25632 stop:26504 length:873 start_codon:yes stop_codon:yes gene_type:complete
MFRRLVKIIYSLLSIFDYIFIKFFKKKIFLVLKELIEEKSYEKIKIKNNDIFFFCPNDLISWRIQTFYTKEPETLEWIDNFNYNENKKIIFWDIGANIGLYSIYAAIKWKNIDIHSFEPSSSNLRILSRNVSINDLHNKIFINPIALNDANQNKFQLMNETTFLEGSALHSFGSELNFEGKKIDAKNKYKIIGLSMNDYIKYLNQETPNYIKVDVDGIEHLILNGGKKILQSDTLKEICIELNENYIEQTNLSMKILMENNFELFKKERSKFIKISKEFDKSFNYFFKKK